LPLSTGLGGVFPPGYPVARDQGSAATATFAIVEAVPQPSLTREVLLVWFSAPPLPDPNAPQNHYRN
jgi:cell shape-determining protein MreC